MKRRKLKLNPCLKVNKNLCYILGVLKGDGWVTKNACAHSYKIGLSATEQAFTESFVLALKQLGLNPFVYNRIPKNKKHRTQFVTEASSRKFYDWYSSLKLENIRTIVFQKNSFILSFLRGFYESEGSLRHRTKNCYSITIYNSDFDLINFVNSLLKCNKFETNLGSHKRNNKKREYRIYILKGTKEIKRFLNLVNPCIKGGV